MESNTISKSTVLKLSPIVGDTRLVPQSCLEVGKTTSDLITRSIRSEVSCMSVSVSKKRDVQEERHRREELDFCPTQMENWVGVLYINLNDMSPKKTYTWYKSI